MAGAMDPVSDGGMAMMEHPDTTVSAPALLSERVILNFIRAIQLYAATVNAANDVALPLRQLRSRIENLRGLATLVRLAVAGHPLSLARVADELECLAVDFPQDPLSAGACVCEPCATWPGDQVLLASAVDLFVGAAFASKDEPAQRDRFVIAAVRAIEDAIAFPLTYAAEAATYIGQGDGTLTMVHATLVIANAMQRLIEGDTACVPRLPRVVRHRLECIATEWMRDNPVDAFFCAIAGPRVERLVLWQNRDSLSCAARQGDSLTVLSARGAECCGQLAGYGVMFAPHAPAAGTLAVDGGFQVRVPDGSRTGPVAIVKQQPDFAPVQALAARWAARFPDEWQASVFSTQRMDVWAFVDAYPPPILHISAAAQPPANDQPAPSNSMVK